MGAIESGTAARYRDVLALGEFRALFVAQLVSVAGDQLARVALAVLVYQRTDSAGWTALTYALTFLPDLIGGPLLSGVADRRPRRQVMVCADLLRAVLVAAMVPMGAPLWLVGTLVAVVQLGNTPWGAARAALLAQFLEGDQYIVGQAMFNVTTQTAQVIGFATGGAIVAALGPHQALAVDACTFLLSGLLVRLGVRHRPPSWPEAAGNAAGRMAAWWGQVTGGMALVWQDLRLRALVALACVSGIYIAAEALAEPYASSVGGGDIAAGLLFAAYPAGTVVGMAISARLPMALRQRWMVPMAVLASLPLVGCAWRIGLTATLVLWALAGVASAYNLTASTAFVQYVPNERRGQAFGLAVTAMRVSQGLGVILAGLAAQRTAPHDVVAAAGVIGVLAAAGAGWWWRVAPRSSGATAPSSV